MVASTPDTAGPVPSARAASRRSPWVADVLLITAGLAQLGAVSEIVLVAPAMPPGTARRRR